MARSPSVVMTKAELRTAKAQLKFEIKGAGGIVKGFEKDLKTLDAEHAKAQKALVKQRDAANKLYANLSDKLQRMAESSSS